VYKILQWSKAVNKSIKEELGRVNIFEGAEQALQAMSRVADVVVVSSANSEAVNNEWLESGLSDYVAMICSQNDGSKKEIIAMLINQGYDPSKVLMIGDARGDYMAAKENGAHYYEITYGKEKESWSMMEEKGLKALVKGNYIYDSDKVLRIAMEDALKVIRVNVDEYTDRFQHVSDQGIYPKEENKLWTMGFYPGQLYLAYDYTGDDYYLSHRETILKSFKERCDHGHMQTHDIGFLFEMTAYYDYIRTGDKSSKDLFLAAADRLMLRYNEPGGFIQAWGPMSQGSGRTRIIIDTMMNLPLLYLATDLSGDPKYAQAGKSHAMVSSKTLIRDDYSSYHTYWMDIESGQAIKGATHQGFRDESTWARGQAWAIYGFYKSYQGTKDTYFLDLAIRCADVFLKNLPTNDICYWDFAFTDKTPDIRDSSAASIAACGLLKIGQALGGDQGDIYKNEGIRLLRIMANRYQNNNIYPGCGILKEGMYHRDSGARAFTSWGDYYYVEALSTFIKDLDKL